MPSSGRCQPHLARAAMMALQNNQGAEKDRGHGGTGALDLVSQRPEKIFCGTGWLSGWVESEPAGAPVTSGPDGAPAIESPVARMFILDLARLRETTSNASATAMAMSCD